MSAERDFLDAYDEQVWAVYGFLAHRARSIPDAEDLTQRTFELALRSWSKFDPAKGEVRTWLLAIARNVYLDWRRAGSRRPEEPREPTELADRMGGDGGVGDPARHLPSPEIQAAVARLGTREREAVALRFGADLPIAEIAEITGVSVANAQQIISRALRKMRRELDARADPLRIEIGGLE